MLMSTVSPAFAASDPTSSGRVTFGVEPATAAGADGRPNFSFGVTPGAFLSDHVAALNYSSTPLSLQLYATDAIETPGGGFGLLAASAKPTGAGSWISIPSAFATVLVPAQTTSGPGQVVVPITVRIPDKATPGDHVGGVVVSLRTTGANSSGQNVILEQRVGTRVFIRVSGTLAPKLELGPVHAAYQGTLNPVGKGQVKVSYLIRNTGNVDLALDHQSVSVSGVIGSQRQVNLGKIPLLLPGASLAESVVVPGVWPQFLVHDTETARPVALDGTSASPLVPVTTRSGVWAIPWTLLAVIVLVVLAVLVFERARSRRAARSLARQATVAGA